MTGELPSEAAAASWCVVVVEVPAMQPRHLSVESCDETANSARVPCVYIQTRRSGMALLHISRSSKLVIA
jgi:hypothetical protein